MKISEDIKPISYFKTHTNEVLEQIKSTRRPVIITQNGSPAAILEDVKTFENRQEMIALLEIVKQGLDEIKEGDIHDHEDVISAARNKLQHENA